MLGNDEKRKKSFRNEFEKEPTNIQQAITNRCRNLMRRKVPTGLRAELHYAPGVLQIKDSSGGNLLREPTKGTY